MERQQEAHKLLDTYIEASRKRKTPERYAILDAVLTFEGHFTVDELSHVLEQKKFFVSRATLYNTLRLFLKINLVVRHRLADKTTYEYVSRQLNHCHQICTMCGKVTEVNLPEVDETVKNAPLRRFRKENYSLYIYGICSSCAARLSRMKKTE
ncbi:MAG: Fur family transcriptional regulator [Prevotella sp.]|jgi:Fur family ferric uptake transcriptional regulator